MIFDKQETKNLLDMLRSADTENATIAFETLKRVDTKKYLGELILLYKFGKHPINEWETNCPGPATAIRKAVQPYIQSDEWFSLSSGACLSTMTANSASHQSIELFMEFFTENMIGFLGQMGYSADQFEINIKLKDGQGTKS
tara:strand:+ start:251 stop:676 length:426 start_codon:yes stop_codon:yes gene_type:complete